ncbi:efflux RND transporter permease subunit [Komagataeibacter rhaeticus]
MRHHRAEGWAGQTINVMTLGGLALAVGILVDDATVMIENIDAHLEMGKALETRHHRRGQPDRHSHLRLHHCASVSCGCRCFGLSGVAGWLFMPMAEAIIFAMIASFILSRTLVPTMAKYMLAAQVEAHARARAEGGHHEPGNIFSRFQQAIRTRVQQSFREALSGGVLKRV